MSQGKWSPAAQMTWVSPLPSACASPTGLPTLSTVLGQLARKSITLPSPSSPLSTLPSPLFFSHTNFKASHTTDLPLNSSGRESIQKKTRTRKERRHRGVREWCRQLSVLLESDQTGLARLLHYILAQSKIVWPGTALPLGAQSFTTHRLYCTQSNQLAFRSLYSTRDNSPSLCVHVCVCVCVCKKEREKKREEAKERVCVWCFVCVCVCVLEMRGNSAAGFPHFFSPRL